MLCTIPVSVNPAPGYKPSLPAHVEANWISDLIKVVTQDICLFRTGAQRHALSGYSIVYRINVSNALLHCVACDPTGTMGDCATPSILEVLEMADIWLAFEECEEKDIEIIEPVAASVPVSARDLHSVRHIALVFDMPTPVEHELPTHIEDQWRCDLRAAVQDDLFIGRAGALRYHNTDLGYSMTYRLDVSSDEFFCQLEEGTADDFVHSVLFCTKVWLAFDPSTVVQDSAAQDIESSLGEMLMSPVSPTASEASTATLIGSPEFENLDDKAMVTYKVSSRRVRFADAVEYFPKVAQAVEVKAEVAPTPKSSRKNHALYDHFFGPATPSTASASPALPTTRFPVVATLDSSPVLGSDAASDQSSVPAQDAKRSLRRFRKAMQQFDDLFTPDDLRRSEPSPSGLSVTSSKTVVPAPTPRSSFFKFFESPMVQLALAFSQPPPSTFSLFRS